MLSYDTWDKKERQVLKNLYKENQFTISKKTELFEKIFSTTINKKYSLMVNSGSSANLLAIAALFFKKDNPLKRGDEVIVPAISWSTTYAPLQQYGLKIIVVDCEPESLNIDINKIKKHITKKTKLIVGVSILGNPAKLDKIKALCKLKKIYFFNDNCESLGARIKEKQTSSFGDISTHSFFYSHHISTIEGGMASTDNFELYCLMNSLRSHGWTRNLPKKNPLVKNNYEGFEQYNFIMPGYNVRPNEIYAALGIVQIKKLENMINIRRKNLKLFYELFDNSKYLNIFKSKDYDSSFSFPFLLKDFDKTLLKKIFIILRKKKIQFRSITGGNFARHTYKKHFNLSIPENLTHANNAHDFGFAVGNSAVNLEKEIVYLHKALKEI
jgi:CDP-6-deoxy-D-xylo-4-hexulose-3-dehydrase|tara:strand:- start:1711 stop:2862 length:1152 start_codon:yes stop_codon:yes gene_type:complete